MNRFLASIIFAFLFLPTSAEAQKNCKKGIPCGNSCISAKKVCRIGSSTSSVPSSTPTPAPSRPTDSTKKAEESGSSTKVWINTKSNVYHCPGTRYFGTTAKGRYSTEKEAIAEGNRAAYGKACGS